LRFRRQRIRKLFRERVRYNIEITTTSYPVTSKFYLINYPTFKLFGLLGVHFNPKAYNHNVILLLKHKKGPSQKDTEEHKQEKAHLILSGRTGVT
jgi:hypothetical protein